MTQFNVPLASAFGALPVGTLLGEFKWALPGGAPDVYFTNIYVRSPLCFASENGNMHTTQCPRLCDRFHLQLTGANPAAPPSAITATVNTALNRKNVSPLVYGVNFADAAQLSAYALTM